MSTFLTDYRAHAAERAALGIPPLALDAKQVAALIELIKNPPAGEDAFLMDLLTHRVPPGVDDAAKVKASFLAAVAHGDEKVALISKAKATELLGTMVGGYNVHPLIELLDDAEVAAVAGAALKKTLLMFDFFNDVAEKAKAGNAVAKEVMQSWADAEWFTSRPEVDRKITVTVFKVPGETNTDDLSPAPDATTRPDIPMHYLAMLKNTRPDAAFKPEEDGKRGPMQFIEDLKKKGHLVAYVGDVVGTGSSRKSATNSIIWGFGEDIPFVPNKRFGGVTLGGKIAPIFFNTQEDSGALPIEVDVTALNMGDVVDVHSYGGPGQLEKDPAYAAHLGHWVAAAQVVGKPLTVSEWNAEPFPNHDRHTLPLLMAAMASHQGWDALLHYAYSQEPFRGTGSPSNWHGWNDPSLLPMLSAGASGYLLKDSSAEEIVTGVREVFAGASSLSPRIASMLIRHVRDSTPTAAAETLEPLTEREEEVLRTVARGRTNAEIADELHISLSTVKTHLASLMQKLGAHSMADLVRYAMEHRLV